MKEGINNPKNITEVNTLPSRTLESYSRRELLKIAAENGGVLHNIILDGVTDGMKIGNSWIIKIFAQKKVGSVTLGSISLSSPFRELRELLKKGRIKSLMEMGFTPKDAEALFNLNIKHKYTLTRQLVEILNYAPLREVFLSFPGEENSFEMDKKINDWRFSNRLILGGDRWRIPVKDLHSLSKMVKLIEASYINK